MPGEDLYSLLGLAPRATSKEIERAYRKLSRKYHPMVNPGDKEAVARYRRICEVFQVLGDDKRRAEYDRQLNRQEVPMDDGRGGVLSPGADEILGSTAVREGFIGEILGLKPKTIGAAQPRKGEDIRQCLDLSFFEAAKGHEITLCVVRRVGCRECQGTGAAGDARDACNRCRGTGIDSRKVGPLVTERECPACGGRGFRIRKPCGKCGGGGKLERRIEVRVKIPAGAVSGSEVRMRGMGHEGENGGPPGDLVINTRVAEHLSFIRKGDNIYTTLTVPVWLAALGATVMVSTLDGKRDLELPPGTQPGQRFRLPFLGVPNFKTGRRGDQMVEVKVVIPPPGDEEGRTAWRRVAELSASKELSLAEEIK